MIVSNTPPPSKYWSVDQKTWYDICLKDKNCTLAYYMTTKDGFPLYSPYRKGWKARSGLVQKVNPTKIGEIIPCSRNALHATLNVEPWIMLDCKIWVVAMLGKIVEAEDKICALKRRIIGSYHPNDLSDETRLVSFPQYNLNQKNKRFNNAKIKRSNHTNVGGNYISTIANVDFTNSTFIKCDFDEIIFNACNFTDASFEACTLKYCNFINCTFGPTYFDDKSVIGSTTIIGKVNNLYWPTNGEIPSGFKIKAGQLIELKKGK